MTHFARAPVGDLRRNTVDDFWSHVDRGPRCWLWTGRTDADGYGRMGWNGHSNIGAHRIAWSLDHGQEDVPSHWVLHRCDNPPCVRPSHLFAGDAGTNNRDRHAKGRTLGWAGRVGQAHHRYRVTPEISAAMREMRSENATQQTIADTFGVSRGHVAHIVSGVLPLNYRGAH